MDDDLEEEPTGPDDPRPWFPERLTLRAAGDDAALVQVAELVRVHRRPVLRVLGARGSTLRGWFTAPRG